MLGISRKLNAGLISGSLVAGIAKRQVCNVVEDLRREIERVKKGTII